MKDCKCAHVVTNHGVLCNTRFNTGKPHLLAFYTGQIKHAMSCGNKIVNWVTRSAYSLVEGTRLGLVLSTYIFRTLVQPGNPLLLETKWAWFEKTFVQITPT